MSTPPKQELIKRRKSGYKSIPKSIKNLSQIVLDEMMRKGRNSGVKELPNSSKMVLKIDTNELKRRCGKLVFFGRLLSKIRPLQNLP